MRIRICPSTISLVILFSEQSLSRCRVVLLMKWAASLRVISLSTWYRFPDTQPRRYSNLCWSASRQQSISLMVSKTCMVTSFMTTKKKQHFRPGCTDVRHMANASTPPSGRAERGISPSHRARVPSGTCFRIPRCSCRGILRIRRAIGCKWGSFRPGCGRPGLH